MAKFADEVRTLVDNIHTSHKERATTLEKLCGDTHSKLQEFQSAHKQMATEQQNRLAAFASGLRAGVATQRKEFQAENEGAHAAWFGKPSKKRK